MVGIALAAFGVLAVANWGTRWTGSRIGEYLTKPAATAAVVVAAVGTDGDDPTMRRWFVVGFVCCLAGDVFLMLPREQFIAGLASFLVGHLAFIAGFTVGGVEARVAPMVVTAAVVGLAGAVSVRILRAVRRSSAGLFVPVAGYVIVILGMALAAGLHGAAAGVTGAALFAISDATLGWNRFVASRRWMPVATMMTYHGALAGLVLALA